MTILAEPLGFEFFRQGLVASVLVGALCGLLGVYVVLRRMSYIGHGLSHSVFGGAVVGYVLAVNFYVAAGLWGFLSALAINATARRRRIGADAAIGIVTTASFAVGVALRRVGAETLVDLDVPPGLRVSLDVSRLIRPRLGRAIPGLDQVSSGELTAIFEC